MNLTLRKAHPANLPAVAGLCESLGWLRDEVFLAYNRRVSPR